MALSKYQLITSKLMKCNFIAFNMTIILILIINYLLTHGKVLTIV